LAAQKWDGQSANDAIANHAPGIRDFLDLPRSNYCDSNYSQSHADDQFNIGHSMTAPVGGYPSGASRAGVFNLSGNVSVIPPDRLSFSLQCLISVCG